MTRTHTELIEELETICPRVYYQEPDGSQLKFPCIVVEKNYLDVESANNGAYRTNRSYIVNFFTRMDNASIEEAMLAKFPYVRLNNYDVDDGLYQETYRVYY